MEALLEYLRQLPAGGLQGDVRRRVIELLRECWDAFAGSREASMSGYKLDRAEGLMWEPPSLLFTIERHGGAVLGSSRAELQHWQVNLDHREAWCVEGGRRQLCPQQRRLDVVPLAEALAAAIRSGEKDEQLAWDSAVRVRVLVEKVIPSEGPATTVAGRRRRLREELGRCLAPDWRESRPNTYEKGVL